MKKLILTIDYELFFGEKRGTVNSCLIEPTGLLANILAKHDSRMTIFWDILHYWKLKELGGKYPILADEAIKIEEQIQKLALANHDIQLHLHPHWISTTFNGRDWQFNLNGYRLHDLSQENGRDDVNSITGCVKIGKNLIYETVKKVRPNHQVNAFRAGGYCIQPFDRLSQVFYNNGIFIDSSVCYGFKLDKDPHSYDFTRVPEKKRYKFNLNINNEDPNGRFIEFPIGSIKVSPFNILWWALLRRLKYWNLKTLGEINAFEKQEEKENTKTSDFSNNVRKGLKIMLKDNYIMLTPDNFFKEKINYLVKHAKEESVMILHPKYLNYHTLDILEKHLSMGDICFYSLDDIVRRG